MAEKDPLLFVHGLFGSLSDETFLLHYDGTRVLAPDLLGYGEYRCHDTSSLSLEDQVEHVAAYMDDLAIHRANFVGHSAGGAVAGLMAILHPDRVKSLISVEGNMTPPDAFWSASLANKSIDDIEQLINGYYADVATWISDAGVQVNAETTRIATSWLDHQPATTIKAQSRAVVDATSDSSGYLERLRTKLIQGLELHLIAGSNSRKDWHVPVDIVEAAKSVTLMPEAGHLMMLQSPSGFSKAVLDAVS